MKRRALEEALIPALIPASDDPDASAETRELLRDVRDAVQQAEAGLVISHEDAKKLLRGVVARFEIDAINLHADRLNEEAEDVLTYQDPIW